MDMKSAADTIASLGLTDDGRLYPSILELQEDLHLREKMGLVEPKTCCKRFGDIAKLSGYLGVSLNADGVFTFRLLTDSDTTVTVEGVKFCPFCGAKLN